MSRPFHGLFLTRNNVHTYTARREAASLNPIHIPSCERSYTPNADSPRPSHPEPCMGFDQYHEPADELSPKTRTFARMIASLGEEAEAINWYEQRMSVEKDKTAKAIMKNAQTEEFKHFGMDLEFLLRMKPVWRKELKRILFTRGDIVEAGEKAEEAADTE